MIHEGKNIFREGKGIPSDHLKVTPEFVLCIYNDKEDIRVPDEVTALGMEVEDWEAMVVLGKCRMDAT